MQRPTQQSRSNIVAVLYKGLAMGIYYHYQEDTIYG